MKDGKLNGISYKTHTDLANKIRGASIESKSLSEQYKSGFVRNKIQQNHVASEQKLNHSITHLDLDSEKVDELDNNTLTLNAPHVMTAHSNFQVMKQYGEAKRIKYIGNQSLSPRDLEPQPNDIDSKLLDKKKDRIRTKHNDPMKQSFYPEAHEELKEIPSGKQSKKHKAIPNGGRF